MRKMPLSRLLAVTFACMLTLSLGMAISQTKFAKAENQVVDINVVSEYRNANKEQVTNVDDQAEVFEALYNHFVFTGDVVFFDRMKEEVEISLKVDSFNDFHADDYSADDWVKIQKVIDDAKLDAKIKNSTFDRDKTIANLNSAISEITNNFKTLAQKFDDAKADSSSEITARKNEILSANISSPDGSVTTTPKFYDSTAENAVKEIAEDAISKITEIDFVKGDNTQNKEVEDIKEKAISDMRAVSPTDIHRACDAIMDYYAQLEVEPVNQENVDLYKDAARKACQKAKDDIISKANDDVLKAYSNEISQINTFPMKDYEPSDFEEVLVDTLQTEDGAIVVKAVKRKDGKVEAVKVFPESATLRVLPNNILSAVKKNISNGIKEINKELDVSYCMSIDIYDGTERWTEVSKTEDDGEVVYQVELDLNKYYENYVKPHGDGVFERLLNGVSFLRYKVSEKNRIEKIISADKYISELPRIEDNSLVYSYNFAEQGKRELTPLANFKLNDGGILMFETSKFGTFATSQSADNNILLNPIFWIVIALAVIALIVILVIIIKNIKYKFIFITDGGTKVRPVKARKGEWFPMPDPPTKEGYVFGGWFRDEECTVRFIDTFVGKRKNVKVYAKWYESDIPNKFVKYYEELRNEILCYSKVGPLSNMGFAERETLAKLFADKEGVYLYVALSTKKLSKKGYSVDYVGDDEEYAETPAMITVTNKESFKDAMEVIKLLMGVKGLQNVGPAEQPQPMSLEERQQGFVFVIENDRVAVALSDYFDYLRVYTKRFVIYTASGAEDGTILTRMYLDDDCINLYLATSPRGTLIDASEKFEDTPALFKVKDNVEDIQTACDYIDKIMEANGLERRNENANGMTLPRPKKGCGCGFVVTRD